MTEVDVSRLREVAEGATPGPWFAGDVWVYTDPIYPDDRRLSNVLGMKFADTERADAEHSRGLANAEFIAAWNPETAKAVLDKLAEAERELRDRELHHFEEEQKSARAEAAIREALAWMEDSDDPDTVSIAALKKGLGEQ